MNIHTIFVYNIVIIMMMMVMMMIKNDEGNTLQNLCLPKPNWQETSTCTSVGHRWYGSLFWESVANKRMIAQNVLAVILGVILGNIWKKMTL